MCGLGRVSDLTEGIIHRGAQIPNLFSTHEHPRQFPRVHPDLLLVPGNVLRREGEAALLEHVVLDQGVGIDAGAFQVFSGAGKHLVVPVHGHLGPRCHASDGIGLFPGLCSM